MFSKVLEFFRMNTSLWVFLAVFILTAMYITERNERKSLEGQLSIVVNDNRDLSGQISLLRKDIHEKAAANEAIAKAVTEIQQQFETPISKLKNDLRDAVNTPEVVSPGNEIDSAWMAFMLATGGDQ